VRLTLLHLYVPLPLFVLDFDLLHLVVPSKLVRVLRTSHCFCIPKGMSPLFLTNGRSSSHRGKVLLPLWLWSIRKGTLPRDHSL